MEGRFTFAFALTFFLGENKAVALTLLLVYVKYLTYNRMLTMLFFVCVQLQS